MTSGDVWEHVESLAMVLDAVMEVTKSCNELRVANYASSLGFSGSNGTAEWRGGSPLGVPILLSKTINTLLLYRWLRQPTFLNSSYLFLCFRRSVILTSSDYTLCICQGVLSDAPSAECKGLSVRIRGGGYRTGYCGAHAEKDLRTVCAGRCWSQ